MATRRPRDRSRKRRGSCGTPGRCYNRAMAAARTLMVQGILAPDFPLVQGCVLVVAVLYAAQAVLMPLALALLLTFILTPPVTWLERRVGRGPAVLVVLTDREQHELDPAILARVHKLRIDTVDQSQPHGDIEYRAIRIAPSRP